MPRVTPDGVEQGFDEPLSSDRVENEVLLALQIVDFVPEIGVDHRLRVFQVLEHGATGATLLRQFAFHLAKDEGIGEGGIRKLI